MENVTDIVTRYGLLFYLGLFAYCALKSGVLPLFAGYLSYLGALDPATVFIATALGGYLGDEARFAIARRCGGNLFAGKPWLRAKLDEMRRLMEHYGAFYIFLYRYPKGMRTIGALPIGLGSMPWWRFTTYNAASAMLWAVVLVGTGYFFGAQVAQAAEQGWGFASVLLLFMTLASGAFAWWNLNRRIAVR